ncbi:MAG: ABC transporter permease subunit [Anaerolineales bacterium]|nr:ABC transporter permease subunit [Anaerolineales bacterium]
MRNIWTIAKREFNQYFVSPAAYVVAFVFLIVLGIIFYGQLASSVLFGGGPQVVQWVFGPFVTLLLFLSPGVTMRLLAEEQRIGTMELLLTAPLREWELVLGKWLAAFAFMALMVFFTIFYFIIVNAYTTPGLDRGAILAAYAGFLLMTAALLAIGVFTSSLFANQIAAFFATMGVALVLWLLGFLFQNQTGAVADVVNYIDLSGHFYNNFYAGVVDLADVVYFVSTAALFLFLTTRVIESRRWR